MSQARVRELLAKGVDAGALTIEGQYTNPRSWGVYKIKPHKGPATRLYRFGNHPVRQSELEREFGSVEVVRLFTSRALAEELSKLFSSGLDG